MAKHHLRDLGIAPTLVDRVVNYFDPVRGLSRLRARAFSTFMGGYIGGARDRRQTSRWFTFQRSADADILPNLQLLRDRSRDLARNAPLATGAVNTVVSNSVGTGLKLQSRIDREVPGLSDDEADAWQNTAEREFALCVESRDFDATRHPRFHMLCTPTGCSWLNMVERFFRDLTEDRLRRGVFRSVEELIFSSNGNFLRDQSRAAGVDLWRQPPDTGC